LTPLEIRTTAWFDAWFASLRDVTARTRIQVRIDRMSFGNFGHHRELEGGVGELKLDFGPGYRIYYARCGSVLVVLLCGGTKRTQNADIKRAIDLAERL
jgi:putative addiction module killer protein